MVSELTTSHHHPSIHPPPSYCKVFIPIKVAMVSEYWVTYLPFCTLIFPSLSRRGTILIAYLPDHLNWFHLLLFTIITKILVDNVVGSIPTQDISCLSALLPFRQFQQEAHDEMGLVGGGDIFAFKHAA